MTAKAWKKTKKIGKKVGKVTKPVTKRIGKVVDNAINMQTAVTDMFSTLSNPGILLPVIIVGGVIAVAVVMK